MKKKSEFIQLEMKFYSYKKNITISYIRCHINHIQVYETEGQKANLAREYKHKSPITFRLKNEQLRGNFPLLLTKTQINRVNKAVKTGVDIKLVKSKYLLKVKTGDFLARLHLFSKNCPSNSSKNSTKSCSPTSNWCIKWA